MKKLTNKYLFNETKKFFERIGDIEIAGQDTKTLYMFLGCEFRRGLIDAYEAKEKNELNAAFMRNSVLACKNQYKNYYLLDEIKDTILYAYKSGLGVVFNY